MITKMLDAANQDAVQEAAELLLLGQLVAFPTDTLYGIGAKVQDPSALTELYTVKKRPLEKGIPVLLADPTDLDAVVRIIPDEARKLVYEFWPGPLTLILFRRPGLPRELSPNEGVAVRIPDNHIARDLIRLAGGAVATSSANRSGSPPAQRAAEVMNVFNGQIAAVLDGGPVRIGIASTIIDFTTHPPTLMREGPIQSSQLGLQELART